MRRFLLCAAGLVLTGGLAAAEVTISGDARMGILSDFEIGGLTTDFAAGETQFHSRARITFTLSGQTDGAMSFGASFRADDASLAADGQRGVVWASGGFGKLSMGDMDGAAQSAVGHVSGVGLTGLGDLNEVFYYSSGAGSSDPTALYEYTNGLFTGYVSVTNPGAGDTSNAVGVKYATDTFSVALGYEDDFGVTQQIILGGSATFGALTAKVIHGSVDFGGVSSSQTALSLDYALDALTLSGFAHRNLGGVSSYGLGASYDLGGGASVVGGYSTIELPAPTGTQASWDIGLALSF